MIRAILIAAALAVLASASPARHHRDPHMRHAGSHSMPFRSVPHRWMDAKEFAAACDENPRLMAAAQRASAADGRRDRASYRAGSVIPMGGGFMTLGYYSVNISINGQSFDMLLDTGSANLAVPGVDCPTCGSDTNRYDPTQSPTASIVQFASQQCATCSPRGDVAPNCPYGQPFGNEVYDKYCGYGISYGGGSSFLGGYLVNEVVTFGQYTVPTTIITMTAQYPNASFSSCPADGILGLCHEWNAVNPTWAPTIFGQIVARSNPALPDLFGICLDPVNGGTIDVGFADTNKYSGQLQWIPQVQERWYNIDLQRILVGSQALAVPSYAFQYVNDQIGTFPDSGTSIILIAPLAFQSFQSVFQSNYASLPGVSGASNIFTGACVSDAAMGNSLSQFPTLYFQFAGEQPGSSVTLPIPASAYMMHQQGQYCLGVQGVVGIGAVLGDVFMQNFYIVHDRAGRRLGFAPVTNCV